MHRPIDRAFIGMAGTGKSEAVKILAATHPLVIAIDPANSLEIKGAEYATTAAEIGPWLVSRRGRGVLILRLRHARMRSPSVVLQAIETAIRELDRVRERPPAILIAEEFAVSFRKGAGLQSEAPGLMGALALGRHLRIAVWPTAQAASQVPLDVRRYMEIMYIGQQATPADLVSLRDIHPTIEEKAATLPKYTLIRCDMRTRIADLVNSRAPTRRAPGTEAWSIAPKLR